MLSIGTRVVIGTTRHVTGEKNKTKAEAVVAKLRQKNIAGIDSLDLLHPLIYESPEIFNKLDVLNMRPLSGGNILWYILFIVRVDLSWILINLSAIRRLICFIIAFRPSLRLLK